MTANTLKSYSYKDLAEMARKRGVHGWHAMRKDQLVKALLRAMQPKRRPAAAKATAPARRAAKPAPARAATNGHSLSASSNGVMKNGSALRNGALKNGALKNGSLKNGAAKNGKPHPAPLAATRLPAAKPVPAAKPPLAKAPPQPAKPKNPQVVKRVQEAKDKAERFKNLAWYSGNGKAGSRTKDRLVVMVRDSFWLHAYWELTRQGVERAQAAMAQEWHAAKPILRMMLVSAGTTTSAAATPVRDIEIHGGTNNWYIDVQDPPKSYRVDIGYRAPSGKFFVLARSNVVTTPKAGSKDAIDEHWSEVAQDYEKIYAQSGGYVQDGSSGDLQELFEERLRRPMCSPLLSTFGSGVEGLLPRRKDFHFDVDAELLVFGTTEPDAHVTLQGDPVRVRSDGSFTVRFSLPNCRQVIPAVACSANGLEQRTVVLAVERNTKVMEPLLRDSSAPPND